MLLVDQLFGDSPGAGAPAVVKHHPGRKGGHFGTRERCQFGTRKKRVILERFGVPI